MIIEYKNKYGYLKFETGEYKHVRELSSKNVCNDLFFPIEDGEKIALITSNVGIQLSCVYRNGYMEDIMFLIHHESQSIGAVCKILELDFTNDVNPEKELEKLNKYKSMMNIY